MASVIHALEIAALLAIAYTVGWVVGYLARRSSVRQPATKPATIPTERLATALGEEPAPAAPVASNAGAATAGAGVAVVAVAGTATPGPAPAPSTDAFQAHAPATVQRQAPVPATAEPPVPAAAAPPVVAEAPSQTPVVAGEGTSEAAPAAPMLPSENAEEQGTLAADAPPPSRAHLAAGPELATAAMEVSPPPIEAEAPQVTPDPDPVLKPNSVPEPDPVPVLEPPIVESQLPPPTYSAPVIAAPALQPGLPWSGEIGGRAATRHQPRKSERAATADTLVRTLDIDEAAAMRAIEGGSDSSASADADLRRVGVAVAAAQAAVESVIAETRRRPPPDPTGAPAGISAPRDEGGDDLRRIEGLGGLDESTLHSMGIYHFDQIAEWSDLEVLWMEEHVFAPGRIEREQWRSQAKALAGR